jgi:hypothetical protein
MAPPRIFFYFWVIESAQRNPYERPRLTNQGRMETARSAARQKKEGRSENTSKLRRCVFLLPAWPSLRMCHLFDIQSLVTWLNLNFTNTYIGLYQLKTIYLSDRILKRALTNIYTPVREYKLTFISPVMRLCIEQWTTVLWRNAIDLDHFVIEAPVVKAGLSCCARFCPFQSPSSTRFLYKFRDFFCAFEENGRCRKVYDISAPELTRFLIFVYD